MLHFRSPISVPGRGNPAPRRAVSIAVLIAALVASDRASVARVSPLAQIEQQVQQPNVLVLLDVSTSMMNMPGDKDTDINETGPDCDNGDEFCRVVGKPGRCYYTSSGKKGPGINIDKTSCTSDADCNTLTYCREGAPTGCLSNGDCPSGASCVNNLCNNKAATAGLCTSDADCAAGIPCNKKPNNFCVLDGSHLQKIKMCRKAQTQCRIDADCTEVAGDSCGPASSRLTVAKRMLSRITQDFYRTVNFGIMTFEQQGYFPYFKIDPTKIVYQTRERLLTRTQLEIANPSCFSAQTGPAATCTINGQSYTLRANANSQYRLNVGTEFQSTDYSWGGACGIECQIPNVGTGIYQGSYYTYTMAVPDSSINTNASSFTGTKLEFADYVGRERTYSGEKYIYFTSPLEKRTRDNIYRNKSYDPISGATISGTTCNADKGAIWDSSTVPFMDTSLALPEVNATNMVRRISLMTEKASMGGLYAAAGTVIGCALKNDGTGANANYSTYHYMQRVLNENAANNVPCRPSFVFLITDGSPNGPGDNDCAHADCALSPPGPGCDCRAVHSARSIYNDLGTKVYVVGFAVKGGSAYEAATLNNIAKAGGTEQAFFALTDQELYDSFTFALYESVQGSYATSPIAVGAPSSTGETSILLDSRVDFPSWRGHLIAYDVSGAQPVVQWDAATGFDEGANPGFWKQRNVWTSNGTQMVKVQVDADGNVTNAAVLRDLGLATTEQEAALVARWMLGDPALGNQAVLGAILNSTPTQVGKGAEPSLTYAGSSDGMLHAFFSRDQTIGGTFYPGGKEAFAYIPQDALPRIRYLFAQGGQRAAPRSHLFGLANSPKVKKVCIDDCSLVGSEVWKYVLIMPQGLGGSDLFALELDPFGPSGVRSEPDDAPVQLLWNTSFGSHAGSYDAHLGKTMSLPAFFYGKSEARDDYRMVFASGYTDQSNSSVGMSLVTSGAYTGDYKGAFPVTSLVGTCSKPQTDPTEPTILADVATARRHGNDDSERIAAAYAGDTWGNLYRFVPETDSEGVIQGAQGQVAVVDRFTCSHPLHLAPTIVQLDRFDSTKNTGDIYIVQLTNSAYDINTAPVSVSWPASQMIIRRDKAQAGYQVAADTSFGDANDRIVLSADNPNQICGVWDANANACLTPLPAGSRPIASSTALLREDNDGFVLITLWYKPDAGGCTKGATYLTIHEVQATGSVGQIHGEKVGDEPVVGAVFVGGKLMVVREDGPHAISLGALGAIQTAKGAGSYGNQLVDRFRRLNWTEVP